jgi:hypothetical protein
MNEKNMTTINKVTKKGKKNWYEPIRNIKNSILKGKTAKKKKKLVRLG